MTGLAISFEPLHVLREFRAFPGAIGAQLEQAGFDVLSLDTCAPFEDGATTIREVAEYWRAECPSLAEASLILGNALGGVVAHELGPHLSDGVVTLTVSAPSKPTERLRARFADVIAAVARDGIGPAAGLLESLAGGIPAPREDDGYRTERAMRGRLVNGLQALMEYSCEHSGGGGRHIAVVGSESQLAGRDDVCRCDSPKLIELSGAGMRAHLDRPDRVASVVGTVLEKDLR
ncbi:hypothetical protein [Rathayibacter iranicus]|uniref:Alpha/beta hydrolase n=2 Tax=Rathayibacter iranicus TaxID=59737 RepID=A0AAD1AC97_9MICO|nr:hypothetical protein [Rathayibacter iranicus]AZZ55578.1 hypothetical protein C7V51_06520 [Rathayibacter iranicus]MWV31045.1 hypothetical protein [Rathayibacter iranicus NCPPB 2253 = VKM Ac-1602]PPI47975.1 hypothetical protein C5E09_05565 [Rathayibacter iranicus]PPI60999.1 hypothetical protein C5E08_06500 [Rathayibacter iranicus]PPI73024.1 hypothetical protein C5E01_04150 [Rathayibacter iranicus]